MGLSFLLLLSALLLAAGVFIFLLGLTILRTGASRAATRATALIMFFAGVGPILTATAVILQTASRESAPAYSSMVENFEYLWEFYFPSLLFFALTYPRQSWRLPNAFLIGVVIFAPYVFHLITLMGGDGFLQPLVNLPENFDRDISIGGRTIPLGGLDNVALWIFSTLVSLHKQLFVLVNMLYAFGAFYIISRNTASQRNPRVAVQLRTVLAGLAVSTLAYVVAKVVPLGRTPLSGNASLALVNLALLAGGGSVAYAVIKQQFLGIKYVTRKAILYGAAAFFFAVIYLAVVKPVSDFFGRYSALSEGVFETGFIILTIIAFQPAFLRIEEVLEGVLLKGKDDPQRMLRDLAARLANLGSEEELVERLREGLRETFDATSFKLWLDDADPRFQRLRPILEEIRGPVLRADIFELAGKGLLAGQSPVERGPWWRRRRRETAREADLLAAELTGDDEVFVPVFRDQEFEGFFTLGEKTYGLKYSSGELAVLGVFSGQIAVALDNVRLLRENVEKKVLEEELQIARRIQSQLLPSASPQIPGYRLSAATVPSRQVGGDYYDFELVDGDSLVVVVADVSGKGIPASLLMATLRAAVNSNQEVKKRPALMLQRVNSLLFQSTSAEEFATVFYGVVDIHTGRLTYASAGHEFPFIAAGGQLTQLGDNGIVLGCMPDFPYEDAYSEIPAKGALILYTDGITDATDNQGESFGEQRLRDVLNKNGRASSEELRDRILREVREFSREGEYHDDLTLVVLTRD